MFDEKFWLALAFFSFLAILIKYVFPSINKTLDNNARKIADDILQAKNMRESAQRLLEEAHVFHKHSIDQAQKILSDAVFEANKIQENAQKTLDEQIEKMSQTALNRIKSEEEIAIRQIKTHIVEQSIAEFSNLKFDEKTQSKIFENSIEKISKI